jgi:hypothetical protein
MTRVYVPLALDGLERLLRDGGLPEALSAFAVTDDLVDWWSQGAAQPLDSEELEYAAMLQAAAGALELLDPEAVEAGTQPARRLVVAADAATAPADPDAEPAPGAVRLQSPLELRQLVALHVDAALAEPSVRAAVSALADDSAPSSHVELVLSELVDHDLGWYAPAEAEALLTELGA